MNLSDLKVLKDQLTVKYSISDQKVWDNESNIEWAGSPATWASDKMKDGYWFN